MKILRVFTLCFIVLSSCYGAFDEDSYLFEAIEYEAQKEFDKARDLYLVLYEETKKLEYLKEAITLSSTLNNPHATLDFANEYVAKGGQKDLVIHKIFLDSYLKLGMTQEALQEAKIIAKSENSALLNDILGSLYATLGDFKNALIHFESAYNESKAQEVLQKIVAVYLSQSQQEKALNLLDSHIENYSCFGSFCKFSIEVYGKFNKIAKIENVFEKSFQAQPTIENAQNLILIYAHQKKFKQASQIATQFPFKPEILLELYIAQQDYKNAAKQAKYAYDENKNPYFLALEQIYTFESSNKKDKKAIANIAQNLKNAINLMQMPDTNTPKDERIDSALQNSQNAELGFLFNFLGYLMIDYELNVKEGVEYVKKALEISPRNPAYLDSLAWGYYKLKDCKNAKETFKLIPQEDIKKEQEIKEHRALIQMCNP
ncbi:ATP-dependent nuclease subunit B [Helicobacter cinaedi]|uniref:ATP-dependent nuclease n=1 Tax=Helicobacter cinaedi TaxID=213 RepID=UPI001F36691E|nr:ATP-dependent nuclease [Helicobacter cinaedi]BDB67315.1 ATP-dependent nuclease subunit B [Helicobacter cinaedi]